VLIHWDIFCTNPRRFYQLGELETDHYPRYWPFNPSASQAADNFPKAWPNFILLDLYGQVPYRTVAKYNSIDTSGVGANRYHGILLATEITGGTIPVLGKVSKMAGKVPILCGVLVNESITSKKLGHG